MKILQSLASGLAGAAALTLVHEIARRVDPDAPRMDILGMRSLTKIMESADEEPPEGSTLHSMAMAGDMVSNSLFYSLTGTGKDAWWRGAGLGLAAGLGAVYLPGPMGLGEAPSNRTTKTQIMTVAWYTLGGLAAAAASRAISNTFDNEDE
ncbi:MAG: hypothetical protein LPJ89_03410 [Hymenobacteraceae bacterium]|mgnify:CR=1 FL=1|nr:hypothetical protein [Hymenobacteraceae bacterium]MDX5396125.1 hypothetical protein [Hymenobacteraceae bacterium]MDX5442811.1 hypothetical protein [Hymenobacteraceae bacterium]MDX5512186.1 hypothetical protein [Hymenobacteraceae bacterium]